MTAETGTQQRPLHHAVSFRLTSGGYVEADITCAAPSDSPCRLTCSTRQCDSWTGTRCACGPLVDYGVCQAVEWLDADGVKDTYLGDDAEVRSSPVEVEWHGGGYGWRYPAEPEAEVTP